MKTPMPTFTNKFGQEVKVGDIVVAAGGGDTGNLTLSVVNKIVENKGSYYKAFTVGLTRFELMTYGPNKGNIVKKNVSMTNYQNMMPVGEDIALSIPAGASFVALSQELKEKFF